ncbi:MAG: hypothetical protein C3F08_03370 [Candidatus Methylomirabilota bacterium]|nr:MAG: hypothetical protein C3F08_03370 [candidate division NC10 bacterium]
MRTPTASNASSSRIPARPRAPAFSCRFSVSTAPTASPLRLSPATRLYPHILQYILLIFVGSIHYDNICHVLSNIL